LLLFITTVSLMTISAHAASQETTPLSLPGNMQPTHSEGSTPDSGQYDRRALRFESHRWTIRVLQGNDGVVVGRTQWFRRFDLASIVSSSDRALSEAEEFNRNRTPGMWALSLGILAVAADAIVVRVNGNPGFVTSALGIGGVVLIVSGAERLDRASEALSKSLWWYNRDLRK
jgi:hypothetical protein